VKNIKEKRYPVVLVQWIISYLSVLVISISTSSLSYAVLYRAIVGNIAAQRQYTLEQVQTQFDNIINNSFSIVNQLLLDQSVNEFLKIESFTPQNRLNVTDISAKLALLKNANSIIDELCLYMTNTGNIITASVMMEEPYLRAFINKSGAAAEWENIIGGGFYEKPYHSKISLENMDSADITYFAFPTPITGNDPAGIIFVGFSNTKMTRLIQKLDNSSWYAVVANDSLPVFSTIKDKPFEQAFNKIITDGAYTADRIKENGQKYDIEMIKSGTMSSIKYFSVTHTSYYTERMKYFLLIIILPTFLVLLLGIFLSWRFSRNNYYKLEKLLDATGKMNTKHYGDVFKLLQSSVEGILKDKEATEDKLQNLQKNLKTAFIVDLINNNGADTKKLADTAYEFGFKHGKYAILAFELINDTTAENYDDNHAMQTFVIKNVYEELFGGEEYNCYVCIINNRLTGVLNMRDKAAERLSEKLAEIYSLSYAVLYENFAFDTAIAVSGIYSGVENLPVAFREASLTHDLLALKQKRGTLFYSEIDVGGGRTPDMKREYENTLRDSVRDSNQQKVNVILDDIFELFAKPDKADINMFRNTVFDLAVIAMRISWEIKKPLTINADKLAVMNVTETKEFLHSQFKILCGHISESKKTASRSEVLSSVIDLVESNILNPSLNIQFAANELGYNPKYIARLFKEQMNEKLLDYITRTRIKKAKELLRENKETSVDDIAKTVGYSDGHALTRVMKKFEKTTPGQYRNS
jgi:AraC-like DNA-binding protein